MTEQVRTGGAAAHRVRRRRRPWWLLVLAVATVAMVVFLLSAYVPPDMATSRVAPRGEAHYILLVAHIFTAAVATVAGLAQFWPWLRTPHPRVHRWTGRTYFFAGVFPSALLAVPVAVLAPVGSSNQAALLALDLTWIVTGVAGYRAVRQRRYADHRRWMIRNYATTLASLASRLWGPLIIVATIPQAGGVGYQGDVHGVAQIHDIASGGAWLALFANLVIAEWYIQRRYGVPRRRTAEVTPPERTPAAV